MLPITLLPFPLNVKVFVALAPGTLPRMNLSLYGPEPGATVKVTAPPNPQLPSACATAAKEVKLVAEDTAPLSIV